MDDHSDDSSEWEDEDTNTMSDFFGEGTDTCYTGEYFSKKVYEHFEWKTTCEPTDCQPPIFTADPGIKVNIDETSMGLFDLFCDNHSINRIVANTNGSVNSTEADSWTDVTPQAIKSVMAYMMLEDSMGKCNASCFFELFFDNHLTNLIVTNTNKKASIKLTVADKERLAWTDVTPQDIKSLVAYIMLQDSMDMSSLTGTAIKKLMPPTYVFRMSMILKFIDFGGNAQSTSTLIKTKPLIDFTRKKFKEVLIPEQQVLLDMSDTILFEKDRSQHTDNEYSIETYMLYEISSNYIWNFLLRLTSSKDNRKFAENLKENVVEPLMKDLFGRGYCMYSTNYYNTMEIATLMRNQQTGYIGTLKKFLKNIPKELLEKKVKAGESEHVYEKSGKFILMKWGAKQTSGFIISTFHQAEDTVVITEKGKEKTVPKLVLECETANRNIVYEQDCLSSFPFEKNCKIDVKTLFRHVVHMMASNAHAIYKKQGGKRRQCSFITRLATELIMRYYVLEGTV